MTRFLHCIYHSLQSSFSLRSALEYLSTISRINSTSAAPLQHLCSGSAAEPSSDGNNLSL